MNSPSKRILIVSCLVSVVSTSSFSKITTERDLENQTQKFHTAVIQSLPDYQALAAQKEAESEKFFPKHETLGQERDQLIADFKEKEERILSFFGAIKKQAEEERISQEQGILESSSMLQNLKFRMDEILMSPLYIARAEQARSNHQAQVTIARAAYEHAVRPDRSWRTINDGRYENEHLRSLLYRDPLAEIHRDMGINALQKYIEDEKESLRPEISDMIESTSELIKAVEDEKGRVLRSLQEDHEQNIRMHSQKVNDLVREEKEVLDPFYARMAEFDADALNYVLTANDIGAFDL